MTRLCHLLVALVPLFAATGCPPPADPIDDDDTSADDDDHEHGTGETDTHIHAVLQWGDTDEIVLGTHTGMVRTEAGSDELVSVFDGPDFMALVQSPFDPDTYWASGHWGAAGLGNWGFAESIDRGETWQEISLPGSADFHQMAVDPHREGVVAGRWSGDIHLSSDSGRTWDAYASPAGVNDLEVLDVDAPTLLLATAGGVLRADGPSLGTTSVLSGNFVSVDRWGDGFACGNAAGGIELCDAAFADCETIDGPSSDAVLHVLAVEGQADEMYALTAAAEVFHTDDGGETWELIVQGE